MLNYGLYCIRGYIVGWLASTYSIGGKYHKAVSPNPAHSETCSIQLLCDKICHRLVAGR